MGLRDRKEFGMKKVFIGGSTRFLEFEQGRLQAVGLNRPGFFRRLDYLSPATMAWGLWFL